MLLPLVILAMGAWEVGRGAEDQADLLIQHARLQRAVSALQAAIAENPGQAYSHVFFRHAGTDYAGPLALEKTRDERNQLAFALRLATLRRTLPPIAILAAAAAGILSVLVLAAAALLGRRGRASRDALVSGFSLMRRLLPPLLVAQIALAAIGFFTVALFELAPVAYADSWTGGGGQLIAILVGLTGALLYGALRALLALRRVKDVFTPDPLVVAGRLATRAEAPGLWSLLDDLSARLGALLPDNVVLGLTGGFFVSSGPKRLESETGTTDIAGRTLYVPLPFLPLLAPDEVSAVVGHELAHFSGGDTDYSLRFVPIYAGVERSLDAVAAAAIGKGSGIGLATPALNLGVFVMDQFHHAVRHWSRLREFAADQAGARVASPDAQARALLRVPTAAALVDTALNAAAESPATCPADLVADTLHRAQPGLGDPACHLEEEQPHPTDTHPPTRQRLAAMGVDPTPDRLAEAAAPPPPDAPTRLSRYLSNPAATCLAATADFRATLRQNAEAFRTRLQQAVAEVAADDLVLHENTLPGALTLMAVGALFAIIGGFVLFIALATDHEPIMTGIALLAFAAGLGLVAYGVHTLRRARNPVLVLRPRSLAVPALATPLPWAGMDDLDMLLNNRLMTTRILLAPEAPFPTLQPGSPHARRIKLDPANRIVTLAFLLPRGMKAQAFADLLGRYRTAEHARKLLAESTPDPEPPP